MIIWRILSSEDERFATAIRRGTWKTRGKTGESYRVQPMLIEWEPGFKSVEVGDFTDPSGGSDLMIVGGVAKSLKKNGIKGFSAGRVEFSNNLSRGRGRRPFEPRDLPKFYELLVKFVAEIDLEKTTFRIKRHPTIEEEREYYENIREGYGAILDKYPKLSKTVARNIVSIMAMSKMSVRITTLKRAIWSTNIFRE